MNARTGAHLDQLAAAYTEHARALHVHLGVTATITPHDAVSADDILPGPPMDYALRARLESGFVIDAYEQVQWPREGVAALWPDGMFPQRRGLFAPRWVDRPGRWCVEVKRWVPVTLNDSLADRNARAHGLYPVRPVEIVLQLDRLCCVESPDRSPQSLVHAVIAGLCKSAQRPRSA